MVKIMKNKKIKIYVSMLIMLSICLFFSTVKAYKLTLTPLPDKNAIQLDWEGENNNYYKIWQLKPGDYQYHTISAIDVYTTQEKVQVLNIHPNQGERITFNTYDGEVINISKSGNTKQWMEQPNGEDLRGYGRGLIEVTPVTIDEFNNNPSAYLSKDAYGNYFYDVVYVGHWDYNGRKALNEAAISVISEFLDTGRGVLCRT